MGGLNFTYAPPPRLVTSFFVMGALFFFLSGFVLYEIDISSIHYLDPQAVGFVHLFLLGFVMSVIFGAMYQLISVILEIPLFSVHLAYTHLVTYILGLVPFLIAFLDSDYFGLLGYGSLILYASFILYIINILVSLQAVKKYDIKFAFILTIHILLFIGVTYGLLSALGLVHGLGLDTTALAHTHIVLVLFGFVGGLIAIIATVLLPMFMLSHNFNKQISNYLLYGFIAAAVFALFGWFLLAQIVMIAVIITFSYQLYDIFIKRLRKQIDIYALNLLISGLFLLLSILLIGFLGDDKVAKVFAIFLFFGFLSTFIAGHVYKIVPFLVWNEKFAPLVGEQKVPMLSDMVADEASYAEFFSKIAFMILATFGILLSSVLLLTFAKLMLLINGALLLYNIGYIFYFKG